MSEISQQSIGFYNFENLFDLEDHPDKRDEEFTPEGSKNYTKEVYEEKLDHLARVVSELGTDLSPDGVSLLGVAEIENRKVLEDFVKHPLWVFFLLSIFRTLHAGSERPLN